MFERFTESAVKAIMLAQEEARRLGHNFVGTEMLLMGVYSAMDSNSRLELFSAEVSLKDLRLTVESIIGRASGFVAVEVPFTPNAKRCLEYSWDIAKGCGCNFITPYHILAGILKEGESVAVNVLERLSVDATLLFETTVKFLKERYPGSFRISSIGFQNLLSLVKEGWRVEHTMSQGSQDDRAESSFLRMSHIKDHILQELGTIGRFHANQGEGHTIDLSVARRPEITKALCNMFIAIAQLCNEEGITADELESSLKFWARENVIN
ncbi:MAG: Clp protease N-terminal domain-containing protein [bacterium]|nr:Clp protease N-terminal domain-containing protein [bacterium]